LWIHSGKRDGEKSNERYMTPSFSESRQLVWHEDGYLAFENEEDLPEGGGGSWKKRDERSCGDWATRGTFILKS